MRPWRRSLGSGRPILTLVLGGIIGGAVAAIYSLDALRSEPLFNPVSLSAPFFGVLFVAVGVLVGWFVALALMAWAPGRTRCPRCGAANKRGAELCVACRLPFS
ncbi:MAG: hypothetical protein WB297_14400 [Actinomycetota bacterium]